MTDPIPMILFCPTCGSQHIDRPVPGTILIWRGASS